MWCFGILESAHKLKTGPQRYQGVHLAKDRTVDEMRQHRLLLLELKTRIRDQSGIRWAIMNGKVVNKGPYTKPVQNIYSFYSLIFVTE